MIDHEAFRSLLLLTLLGVAVPFAVRLVGPRLRLPIVVGEIVAGMIFGGSGLGLLHEGPIVSFLAEFGFIFLMFLSGLELDLGAFSSPDTGGRPPALWRRPNWLAGANFLVTLALAGGAGWLLWHMHLTKSPLLMGLILCTTSLGIVVPVLKERRLLEQPFGQMLLLSALLADFVTLLLLGVVITLESSGAAADLLLFLVLLVAFFGAARLGRWATRSPLTRRIVKELSHATAQIRIRGAFALIVAWVVLSSALGIEVILGAFLAGAVIRQSGRTVVQIFEEKLDAIGYGLFIPIFFLMVGARVDFGAMREVGGALWLVPLLVVTSYLVKLLPALLFRFLFPWRETLAAGFLLSSRLSLIIAASAIALELDLITPATNSALVLVAVVTCTLSPILFSRLAPTYESVARSGILLVGTDSLAEMLGTRLAHSGEPVTFVGKDAARLERLERGGFRVVHGAPDDEEVLRRAGAATIRGLIAVSSDPEIVLRTTAIAKRTFQVPSVIARADQAELVSRLQELEVRVVQTSLAMALSLEGALLFPEALSTLLDKSDDFELSDAPLGNPGLLDRPLREVHLPAGSLVLGIRRRGEREVLVPHGDTLLREGDVLMLSGRPEALTEAGRFLGGR
ncbi:MAG: monovalent cation:proton antiporter family protein [Thermoanaerobaculia bacterium]